MNSKKQNILIVMADQLTALALGCYGNPVVKSPNIDRLADEGVLFESAYSSSPLCTPARYAFMTGQNISNCGGYDNASYMPATMPTFAHYLRLMGYRSCLSGKMHFVGPDQLHGFEDRVTTDIYPADFGWVPDWTAPDDRIDLWYHNMSSVKQAGVASISNQLEYDDEVGAQAMRVIYDHARNEDDRPLCLVASFIHPHDPYAARQKYWDLYEGIDIPGPTVKRLPADQQDAHNKRLEKVIALDAVDVSDAEIINARRAYYANVSYVDEWLGRLRATLEECDMADKTTIIFTADHGDMLGEFGLWYKMSFREWSCRIPMIIHQPGRFSAGRVKAPVAQVDLLPTLLDVAAEATSNKIPDAIDPLDGRSLLPLCDGDSSSDPDSCVSEYLAEGTGAPMLMIRRGNFKYISCITDAEQLYNLENDPDELNNLSSHELLAGFRSEAEQYWDAAELQKTVIADQKRRRAVHAALRVGRYQDWDFNPERNASEEYTRSHLDLTRFDITSRYPRPAAFKPKWK
ncbi:MAG: choline-sulfatase [Gammaproteobacteria bacterium]|jgi:choline-sulfatase